ncbi:MAG: hypothetical protein GWP02_01170 [Desulfobulbaceae bacterium]|nr:hypothetical protein [Desulfobulbaceae bacterium]
MNMRSPVYLLALLCFGLSSGNLAAAYTLTRIVDDGGQFADFSGPTINNNGTVSYQAIRNDGVQGIYTGAGTKVIDSTGLFQSFGAPSVNDSDITAYQALLDSGVSGVYKDAGNKVVDSTGSLSRSSCTWSWLMCLRVSVIGAMFPKSFSFRSSSNPSITLRVTSMAITPTAIPRHESKGITDTKP